MGGALNARDAQTFMISSRPCPAPQACTALKELHLSGPCSPALHDLCFAGQAPKACTALQELLSLGCTPQPCMISALQATPPKPAQHCTIFTLQDCAPKACQARVTHTHTYTHTHDLHSAQPCPPSLSSQGYTDMQDLHSASLCPSGTPSPCSKGPLLHLS
jgi:hypothetical protein